ncbi:MAG TPA: amidohydrolase family protein [Tepidanaerobacter syntrophicus]|nr:amidohydrolase family protein [Tepidanaerobacter syntrophicus]
MLWDLIIKNGNILTLDAPLKKNSNCILIKNGIISDIVDCETAKNLQAQKIIDATGLTVMPGLIDCHTHLCEYATEGVHHTTGKSQKMAAISNYLDCLKSGITTVGDHHLGHPLLSTPLSELKHTARNIALAVKFTAGMCCLGTEPLSYTSSLKPGSNLTFDDFNDEHFAKLAVESEFPGENIFVTATVANLPPALVPNGGKLIFNSKDICKIVDIFHAVGKRIGAHIEGAENIQIFIDAGGDVIHHGHGAENAQFIQMANKKIALVATPHGGTSKSPNTPEDIYNALNANVVTAIATDSYLPVHPKAIALGNLKIVGPKDFLAICKPTFEYLNNKGISKTDCLKLITVNAAKIMGLDLEIGSIKKLKRADIILCKGVPVFDFTNIESIAAVIKEGVIEINNSGL